MPIVIYRNPDGSVGARNPDTGDLMVAPTQEEFEECCCGCVVIGAKAVQPSAVVKVTGTCDQGAGACNAAGIYPRLGYLGPPYLPYCLWGWRLEPLVGLWDLELKYDPVGATFCAVLIGVLGSFGKDADECYTSAGRGTDVTAHISVVNGILTGAFVLVGDVGGLCENCTATITLG